MKLLHLPIVASLSMFGACIAGNADPADRPDGTGLGGKADSFGERPLSSEDDLTEEYILRTLLPRFDQGQRGRLDVGDDIQIDYVQFPVENAKGAIVVLNGRTESFAEYLEVIEDFRDRGYNLYLMDHRGQGFSSRMLDDRERGFVADYNDYVEDFRLFLTDVVAPENPGSPIYAVGHSTGGGVIAQYLLEQGRDGRDDPEITASVLFAPMIQMSLGGDILETIADVLAVPLRNSWYAFGKGPYDPEYPFEDNGLTSSRARFDMQKLVFEELYPDIRIGGPTWGWLGEAIDLTESIRAYGHNISVPLLIMSAEKDSVVEVAAQHELCEVSIGPEFCTIQTVSGAEHEILMESDSIRNPAILQALDFIDTH